LTPYCWGHNRYGQLGDGSNTDRDQPTRVVDTFGNRRLTPIIRAGFTSTCIGTLDKPYCWGDNDKGQLGTGDQVARNVPAEVQGKADIGPRVSTNGLSSLGTSCALTTGGEVYCWGYSAGYFGGGS